MVDFAVEKLPSDLTPKLVAGDNKSPAAAASSVTSSPSATGLSNASSMLSADSSKGPTPPTPMSLLEIDNALDKLEKTSPRIESMSFGQSRFWFLRSYLEDQIAFNVSATIELRGSLDVSSLAKAVQTVAQRHAALRTRFFTDENGQYLQEVLDGAPLQLEEKNISNPEDVAREFSSLKSHVYNLESGELMKILLLSQSRDVNYLLIGYHHINMDSMSLQILLSDLDKVYRGLTLSPTVLQYPDFAARQRQASYMDELKFWRDEYPNFPPVLPLLPFSRATFRKPLRGYEHNRVDIKLDSTLATRIKNVCLKSKVTPFHFYLSALKSLLFRFLDIDDVSIGMADANRNELNTLGSIGMYLNLLPLRFRRQSNQRFEESLKEAQSKVRVALANSRLPFDLLIEQLDPPRSPSYSPIFQSFIDYRPPMPPKKSFANCQIGTEEYDVGKNGYDITIQVVDSADGRALIMLQVQSSLYSESDATVLMKSYRWLLEQFSAEPAMKMESASLFSPRDVEDAIRLGAGQFVGSS
ncbi:hypothetical protein VTN77DRAFT_4672 [Rasamsonia byssochlamydoides]|uniref:uncharacterized protein n=1 Tax=Rasamsonia byssochlamydoides TaxID=89139 RepID=UPI003743D0ED